MTSVIDILDLIPTTEHAAIFAGTSLYNAAPAINAAIASPGRKRLVFPPGQVALASQIFLMNNQNNIDVVGSQTNLFMLGTAQGGSATAAAFWIEDCWTWSVSGFRIDGNKANRVSSSAQPLVTILFSGEFIMRDTKVVLSSTDGISVGYNNPSDAGAYCREGLFDNVHCEANDRNGWSVDGARHIRFQNCRSRGHTGVNPRSGYALEPSSSVLPNQNISFVMCQANGNAGHGVYADSHIAANTNIQVFGSGGFVNNTQGNISSLAGASISVIG